MGKIKQGILGGFSGAVGPVVGGSWKGIATIKSKPLSVANPRSPGQVAQRGKFARTVSVARLLLANIIQTYWNPFAQRQSGYNAFVSRNIGAFTADGLTTFDEFFSMRGSLVGMVGVSAGADASDALLSVDFTDNSGSGDALATDEIVVVAYNATKDVWYYGADGTIRSAGVVELDITGADVADVLHVYVSASRPNVSKVSDSSYITTNVVA